MQFYAIYSFLNIALCLYLQWFLRLYQFVKIGFLWYNYIDGNKTPSLVGGLAVHILIYKGIGSCLRLG